MIDKLSFSLKADNIIYFSRFYNNPSGNGGDKRTAQICDIMKETKYLFVSMFDPSLTIPKGVKQIVAKTQTHRLGQVVSKLLKQHFTYWKYNKWSENYRDQIVYWHLMSKRFIKHLDYQAPGMLLLDDPIFLAPVLFYAKKKSIPVVALCHNLETLSREQITYVHQREMFKYELDLLSMCALVVTISMEETFLLKNLGMDPLHIPYYPVKEAAERFKKISIRRQYSIKKGFLLLGTVYNIPTLEGMKKILSAFAEDNMLTMDKLYVAGYGTDKLLPAINLPCVELIGELTDTQLDEALAVTKGCIVYQDNGSGALTKIPELLMAGVPVVVNSHAARSYHNLPGIFEFKDLDGLKEKLQELASNLVFSNVLCQPDTMSFLTKIKGIIPHKV